MIRVILWDIDGTLLNFREAEKYAIRKCFDRFRLGECSDEMLARYSRINDGYWKKLEQGKISKPEVLTGRFTDFFAGEGICFTDVRAFNEAYQVHLGDLIFFNDDSYALVKKLKGKMLQYAVTNGTAAAQKRKLERSGLDKLFDGIFISEETGTEKPGKAFFDHIWEKIGTYAADEVMIVGDSLTSDMQGGVNAGILCCWYNPQNMPNTAKIPVTYEIRNLWEVEEIVKNK